MAAETRKSRKSNFSQEEIDVLVTTVMQNHDILYKETSKSFFHKEIRNQVWNIILEEVNKVSLERRTLNEVKNKWKKCQYNLRTLEVSDNLDNDDCDDLDSMPLQQRLSQNHNEPTIPIQPQETVLQSQPISPTKLKVTRQGKPQAPPPRVPTPPPPPPPQVCLKWNSHHVNMQSAFPNLLSKEQYVDATLVSEGKTLKCHRMILSSCSPYFEEVLNDIGPFQHPVLFMKDIPFWVLKALCDFMYAGEVHILQEKLQELLNAATALKIKGLAGPSDTNQDVKPIVPEIKQEIEATPPPKIPDKPVKEEKVEEPPPPPPKPTKHEVAKPSKKKEEKKSKHASHAPKEKEKVVEEPPPPPPPKVTQKAPAKVVAKVVLPKIHPPSKSTVKNVVKNVLKTIPKPSTSKTTHTSRKSDTSRKSEKQKAEVAVQKEKEKEKEKPPKPPLKKDNINDPLDLLQPVYEEIAKEEPPPSLVKTIAPGKLKERGNVQVKKSVNRKVKKRRYAEYAEEREESPPPLFHSRKGTRSRPNVKIPKFFHTHFDDSPKETVDATIVREPHTDQNDPLIGVEVEEIKAEPLDVEENTIEMEENLVNFMVQDQESIPPEDEEIIGNYDSPLVNIKREPKSNTPNIFKKLDPPIIMDVHTVTTVSDVGLLNIKKENVQIVDIGKISNSASPIHEAIIGTNSYDTIEPPQEKPTEILISSVQSMAGLSEEDPNRDKDTSEDRPQLRLIKEEDFHESIVECPESAVILKDNTVEQCETEGIDASVDIPCENFSNMEVLTSQLDQGCSQVESTLAPSESDPLASVGEPQLLESEEHAMEIIQPAMNFKIENVTTANSQNSDDIRLSKDNMEVEQSETIITESFSSLEARVGTLDIKSEGSVQILSQGSDVVGTGSLGSLEANIGAVGIYSDSEAMSCSSQEIQHITQESGEVALAANIQQEVPLVVSESEQGMECLAEPLSEDNKESSENTEAILSPPRVADLTESLPGQIVETSEEPLMTENTPALLETTVLTSAADVSELSETSQPALSSTVDTSELSDTNQPVSSSSVNPPELPETNEAITSESFDTNQFKAQPNELGLLAEINEQETELETQNSIQILEGNTLAVNQTELLSSETKPSETESQHSSPTLEPVLSANQNMLPNNSHTTSQELDMEASNTMEKNQTEFNINSQESEEIRSANEELAKQPEVVSASSDEQNVPSDLCDNLIERPPESESVIEQSTDNIEAELEQCLASTSDISPPKQLKVRALPFEDDEDFTKDIDIDSFIVRNRPTNYLGDEFEADFEMGEIETSKSAHREEDEIDESLGASDQVVNKQDDGYIEMEETHEFESEYSREITEEVAENICKEAMETETTTERIPSEMNEDITTVPEEISSPKDNKVLHEATDIQQNNIDETISNRLDESLSDSMKDKDILLQDLKSKLGSPHTRITTDNLEEHHTSTEEERRMEETLLADLDDDIEMSDADANQEDDDGGEKTLEMIVNDLNESLGEMKK